jgi:transposase
MLLGFMANLLKVHEQNAIQELAAKGWPQRRIAKELNLDRKTVRRYVRAISKSPTILTAGSGAVAESKSPISTAGSSMGPELVTEALEKLQSKPGRPSMCDPHREAIVAKLELGLSAQRIYQDLVEERQFAGSYESIKRVVRLMREAAPERVWRIETEPGEEVQVDFGLGAPVIGEDGQKRRVWILRVVLSYSRKAYSEGVFQQTTENFIRCLENAFRSFGGVAKVINLDNLRAAVSRAEWYEPELNPKLLAFCQHYGCTLLPCRVRTPEHKGKTERSIQYLKSNALKGRVFSSLAAENQFLRDWEKNVADKRIHGTTREQVSSRFAHEQPQLLKLPDSLFPCFEEARRTVHRDSYVSVARSLYSVPPEYIGCLVWARWDGREVRLFNERWEQIALHRRLEPGRFSECLGLGGGNGSLEKQQTYWLKRATELGAPCGQWSRGLLERKGPIGLRSVIGLVSLLDQHSFKRLNEACAKALAQGAWRLKDVRALLEQRQAVEQKQFCFAQSHPLIRNLAEYGLFIQNQTYAE